MVRKKAKFGRRVIQSTEDIPDHLKHLANLNRVPLGNLTIDDYAWHGDDGNWDPQTIVNEVTAPAALLRLVVQAIVGGNPSTKSAEDRVETAMRALLGTGGRKGRRHLSSDERILRRMALEYLQGFHGFKDPHPSLNALAKWALQAEPDFARYSDSEKENRPRVIARKFRKVQDQLLTEFSSTHDWDVQRALATVKAAIEVLNDLGIRIQPLPRDEIV